MLITCPTCSAAYRVPDDAIGPNGRNVQCDSCGAQWRQSREEEVEEGATVARFSDYGSEGANLSPEADDEADDEEDAAEDAEERPRTPGLEEAAALLHEMREESARSDPLGDATEADPLTPPPPPIERRSAEAVTEDEIRATIAADSKSAPAVGRAADKAAEKAAPVAIAPAHEERRGGFRVGFLLAMMVVAALAFAYLASDSLAAQFPGAASALGLYVDAVDAVRGQVEGLAGGVMEKAPATE